MNYRGFVPKIYGPVVIGVERIGEIYEEIRPLHAEHYHETETLYLDHPFDADYERYAELEKNGQFVLITSRLDNRLVGYIQYYVFRDLHTQNMYTAREDAMFITEQARGHGVAKAMLKFAEYVMKELGCSFIGMSSKGPVGGPDIGPFLEKSGYRPVAIFYGKSLES